jgi:hypothetical protein
MPAKRVLVSLGITSAFVACGAPSSVPVGAGQVVELKLQPAVVRPDAQGALALGVVTGCDIDYVGHADTDRTYRFRVRPSQRVPDFETCISRLRQQPGVEGVTVR